MVSQQTIEHSKLTVYGRILRHENGIVYIYVADNMSIDLPQATQIVNDIVAFDDSGKVRLLIKQGTNNDLSFAAQKYLGTANIAAYVALVVQSRLQAEVAQFFVSLLSLLKASYTMKIFSQLTVAEKWLLSQNE